MASAIQGHIERYNLGPILADALMCIQTDSDASESASAFIGLDEGTAGQRFREILIKAAAVAKK